MTARTGLMGHNARRLSRSQRDVAAGAVQVPKVLCRPPGQRQMEWVDLWEAYVSAGLAIGS